MRPKPIILTADWLDQQGACPDQADLAICYFGKQARVTRTMLHECAALGLDVEWLAGRLLPYESPAWAAYQQATATAWGAAYQQAIAPAWAAYQQATATAWAAYQQARAGALADALGLP